VAINRLVLNAPGIRSVVLCNSMIYGNALGSPARSVQSPALVAQAKASGIARYIGRGLNRWSNVHIADVAALYALVITRARAGTFMYVESGEEALSENCACDRRATLVLALRNRGPQRKRSRPGAGTWRCSRSARTAACAAKLRPISAGRPCGGQSRSGSPTSSFRGRSGASPAGLAHLRLPNAGKLEFE
jgi:nucleoside-diphosphate-sugar epimerase